MREEDGSTQAYLYHGVQIVTNLLYCHIYFSIFDLNVFKHARK